MEPEGRVGEVTVRIRGGESPGEIVVPVRGIRETFVAYAEEPLEPGAPVLVFRRRGGRAVDVIPAPWAPAAD